MKKMHKKTIALLLTALLPMMTVSAALSANREETVASTAYTAASEQQPVRVADGYAKAAQSGDRVLYVQLDSGNFYIKNTKTGLCWYANPPAGKDDRYAQGVYKMEILSSLLVNVFDLEKKSTLKKNSETACVRKNNVAVTTEENGFEAAYTFADEGITIPVRVTLEPNGLNVRIVAEDIQEEKAEKYLLNSISLLPNFGAGGEKDEGYVLIPDGSGAIMRFNNGKFMMEDYAQPVYGRDLSYNLFVQPNSAEKIMLPMFGIQSGKQAFAAIITEGDSASVIHAIPSLKNSTYAQGYNEFVVRSEDNFLLAEDTATAQTIKLYQTEAFETTACAVRYAFLEGEQATYSGMAKCFQHVLKQKMGITPQVGDSRRLYLDFYGAVVKKEPFLGIPVSRNKSLSTIEDVSVYLEALEEAGVTGVQTRLMEWSKDGLSGKIETRLAPASVVGSVKDIQALSRQLNDEAGSLYLGIEVQRFQKGGNGFSTYFDGAKSFSNAPAYQYQFLESTRLRNNNAQRFQLLNLKRYGDVLARLLISLKKREFTALSPTSIANNIYGSYGNELTTREDTQKAYTDLIKGLSGEASLMLDFPAAYALAFSTRVVNVPVNSSGFDVFDESIPFYQLVLSGLLPYATRAANLEVNPTDMALHAAETGSSLHYALITGDSTSLIDTSLNTLYSAEAAVWKNIILKDTKQLDDVDDAIQGSEFVSHVILTDGVRVSTYANGAKVVVNYGGMPFDSEWGRVEAHSIRTIRG